MNIKDLKPAIIWKYFDEITKIPRPSKKEEKIVAYLVEFGKTHGLDTKKDAVGNVLITKPATKGREHLPGVILQSHVDMVCEKNKEVEHDFEKDPIQPYIDGDWLKAKGTTLGADNGIGVAAALAVLASDDIEHGKIECLFTIDEETGLSGAKAVQQHFVTGKILLNLDSEDEGEVFIGCAGGADTVATFSYRSEPVPEDYFYFKVNIEKLLGGHSGCDIHLGRANANKLLNRFLWQSAGKYALVLSQIGGGNLRNAIPREAFAVAGIPAGDKEHISADFNVFVHQIEDEFKGIETGGMTLTLESVAAPSSVIDKKTTNLLLNALYACPHGVISMSKDIPGLVETSTNLASVKQDENTIVVGTSQRSSTESEKQNVLQMVEAVFLLAGAEVKHGDGYPGWKPNRDSGILKVAKKSYLELFGTEPHIKAIHAGLECGLFLEKYPSLDMISFGPTLQDVHSPGEKMLIPTVDKFWRFLLQILKNLPG
ncbi:MAG: aminoacyl-histidine dipeptidase [Candidatus Azobacteroides sp.]|nr:aminoacyl-histidine dipeptidase [Candidatus Azobacteroides sp.]